MVAPDTSCLSNSYYCRYTEVTSDLGFDTSRSLHNITNCLKSRIFWFTSCFRFRRYETSWSSRSDFMINSGVPALNGRFSRIITAATLPETGALIQLRFPDADSVPVPLTTISAETKNKAQNAADTASKTFT